MLDFLKRRESEKAAVEEQKNVIIKQMIKDKVS